MEDLFDGISITPEIYELLYDAKQKTRQILNFSENFSQINKKEQDIHKNKIILCLEYMQSALKSQIDPIFINVIL